MVDAERKARALQAFFGCHESVTSTYVPLPIIPVCICVIERLYRMIQNGFSALSMSNILLENFNALNPPNDLEHLPVLNLHRISLYVLAS